jgi:hypothetical protein
MALFSCVVIYCIRLEMKDPEVSLAILKTVATIKRKSCITDSAFENHI